jgi:NAD(P)-dependent dehydrogenase (short-subunit alcohol dehydrogenase family)
MGSRLAGKVALITGSSAGIGRATALLFAREGAKVVVNARGADRGEAVVAEIVGAGGVAAFCGANLSDAPAAAKLVRFTVDRFGRIDVLMNNAAFNVRGTAVELNEDGWDKSVAVMLKAPYLACREAIPHMIRQGGGSIINISSVHGVAGGRRRLVYAAAKAGAVNMVRQIAVDFGPQGIRANAICPGRIVVEKLEEQLRADPEGAHQTREVYPLKRMGAPEDVAFAALYLASDESAFVTGTALMVDGGLTCQIADTFLT